MATTLACEGSSNCSSEEDKTIHYSVKETNGAAKTIAIEAGKSSLQQPTVSLLERPKVPTAADITRKRKTKTNSPPVDKRLMRQIQSILNQVSR